jgi:hypothetical protein
MRADAQRYRRLLLDAACGRNEGDLSWFQRHDEYPATAAGSP